MGKELLVKKARLQITKPKDLIKDTDPFKGFDGFYFLGNSREKVVLHVDVLYGQNGASIVALDGKDVSEEVNSFSQTISEDAQSLIGKELELSSALQDRSDKKNILGIKVMLSGGVSPKIWSPKDIQISDGGVFTFYYRIKLIK